MSINAKLTIDVANRIAPTLGSRDVVDIFRSWVAKSKANAIDIDFSGVDFISRSAAHELLIIKDELEKKNRKVEFINANQDVFAMIRTIAANMILPRERKIDFKVERTDIQSLLNEV